MVKSPEYDVPFRSIRYLGNKRQLTADVSQAIDEAVEEGGPVIDLFAGTCSVSHSLKRIRPVLANDKQPFSYHIAKALIENERDRVRAQTATKELEGAYSCHMAYLSTRLAPQLAIEERLLDAEYPAKKVLGRYKTFCAKTQFVNSPRLRGSMGEFIRQARRFAEGTLKNDPWVLFTTYFSNAYFGLRQSLEIDAIRRSIEESELGGSGWRRHIYLAALTYSLSQCVSAPGHFAQYLKPKSESVFKRLRTERAKPVWKTFVENVSVLSSFVVETKFSHVATCEDWRGGLRRAAEKVGEGGAVYADPPYTTDHYSRYYHVLNTLVGYNYPGCEGAGRYSSWRASSAFSIRSAALDEFANLAETTSRSGASLILSYSNRGVVKVRSILSLCRRSFRRVDLRWINHSHSTQGRFALETESNGRPRREYIISCSSPC